MKLDLKPNQRAQYLELVGDTIKERVYPLDSWTTSISDIACKFLSFSEPLTKLWQQFVGHMVSLEHFNQHERLWMHLLH